MCVDVCVHISIQLTTIIHNLFSPSTPAGDPDDSIFVVQDGSMEIFIQKDGRDILAKVVQAGESVTSLLSILDVLTDHPEPFKTVSGRATRDSTILRLPGIYFLTKMIV